MSEQPTPETTPDPGDDTTDTGHPITDDPQHPDPGESTGEQALPSGGNPPDRPEDGTEELAP